MERTRVFAAALGRLGREPGRPFPCPYLKGRQARHLTLLFRHLEPGFYHALMDLNFRRMGPLVYRPECEGCKACRNLRIPVAGFRPNRSQRRCSKGNADLTIEIGPAEPTAEKHALYRRYLAHRHDGTMDGSEFEFEVLTASTIASREYRYRLEGRLLAVGLVDVEPGAMSAVYCYFDPDHPTRGLGVFNILRMIEDCRRQGVPYVYLGYWVAESRAMRYKADFQPCEVLDGDGVWRPHTS